MPSWSLAFPENSRRKGGAFYDPALLGLDEGDFFQDESQVDEALAGVKATIAAVDGATFYHAAGKALHKIPSGNAGRPARALKPRLGKG